MPAVIGQRLYGFCEGYFGRDSYDDKRIEGVGVDWIVARDDRGTAWFARFDSNQELERFVENNSVEPPEPNEPE